MQVLKFGGTSVANAKNMNVVVSIVKEKLQADVKSDNDRIVIVLSALSGITDALLEAATLASEGDQLYKDKLLAI